MVGDEMGEKVVAIEFRAAEKLTKATLRKLFGLLGKGLGGLGHWITRNRKSLNKLTKDGSQTQGIEVSKEEMGDFYKYARKYHVFYSMVREKNDPTKYIFTFRAKDIDRIQHAARDFCNDGREHESLKEKIHHAHEKAFNINQAREKGKTKEHTKSKGKDRGKEI